MAKRNVVPNRIHLLGHGNPIGPDVVRFGLEDVREYVAFVERHLPKPLRLTYDLKVLEAEEEPWKAGRTDDAARIRDLQKALDDPRTLAIVAASGGAYFARLLPHLKFDALAKRREPFWMLGFSEMSTLANFVAAHRCGRALYWLTPNWIAYRVQPAEAARTALAEYWMALPDLLNDAENAELRHIDLGPARGEIVEGRPKSGRIRVVGGCLAVLAAAVGGPLGKKARPDGKWLLLEDIKESPYRIDRHLAALKMAGWFERAAGVLVGDFRMMNTDTQPSVLELLKYHLPRRPKVPIIRTRSLGHVWPMAPLLLNRPVPMEIKHGQVTLWGLGRRKERE